MKITTASPFSLINKEDQSPLIQPINMNGLLFCTIFLLISTASIALECYTGFSMIRGRTVGSTTEQCKLSTDQCYKGSAEINIINKLKMAGCSTHRCKASPNRCSSQTIGTHRFELCCCSTDLCNTRQALTANQTMGGVINRLKDMIPG